MAITGYKIVSDIRNIASSGPTSIDFRISDRQILFWINEVRSMLISQSLAKKDDIVDQCVQILPNIVMNLADISEAVDIPLNCKLLKSSIQLPQTIDTYLDNSILSITGLDGTTISKSNLFRSKYKRYNKFTGKNPIWYLRNNYLYIVNYPDNLISNVTAVALLEDPEDVNNFLTSVNDTPFTLDSVYPVTMKMANDITNIVLKTKVLPLFQFPHDIENNAQDNGAKNV